MVILFDGYCGLCNKSVDWLIQRNTLHTFKFSPLQGEFAKTLPLIDIDLNQPNSLVVWEKNMVFQKTSGVFQILKKLPFPWKLFLLFSIIPSFISDYVYDIVATNRYRWFGKSESCRIATPLERSYFID
ncbi:MAG: putative DCC family thiol-disulfide oxidoreductase YuxK [Salibacteraceae bacterium]|jgi:predicted DCC family thiol-disulfide oxidoreductase YuxK